MLLIKIEPGALVVAFRREFTAVISWQPQIAETPPMLPVVEATVRIGLVRIPAL